MSDRTNIKVLLRKLEAATNSEVAFQYEDIICNLFEDIGNARDTANTRAEKAEAELADTTKRLEDARGEIEHLRDERQDPYDRIEVLRGQLAAQNTAYNEEADQFNEGYVAGEKGGLDPFSDQPHYEPDHDSWRNGYYAGSYDRLTRELAALKEQTRWIPIKDYLCPSYNEKIELVVRNKFDPTIIEVIHGWWIYEDGDYGVASFFDDHKNEVDPLFYRPLPEPPEGA